MKTSVLGCKVFTKWSDLNMIFYIMKDAHIKLRYIIYRVYGHLR